MGKSSKVLRNGIVLNWPENLSEKVSCVYKLTFDTGKFYIGSTGDLKVRIKCYITTSNHYRHQNKLLNAETKICKRMDFSIIEEVADKSALRPMEDYYLKNNFNDLCLNRSPSAFSNKGISWTEDEKKAISVSMKGVPKTDETKVKMRKPRPAVGCKKVLQYDLKGNYIRTFSSFTEAGKNCPVCADTISKIVSGKKKSAKGYTFRSEEINIDEEANRDILQILSKHDHDVSYYGNGKEDILKAMEEYSMLVAIKFMEWQRKSPWQAGFIPNQEWFMVKKEQFTFASSADLFDMYLKEKQPLKNLNE